MGFGVIGPWAKGGEVREECDWASLWEGLELEEGENPRDQGFLTGRPSSRRAMAKASISVAS